MSFLDKAKSAAASVTTSVKKATRPKRAYKLTYFNIRGLGETSRLIFAVGEEHYEDNRLPFSVKPEGGFDQPGWETEKERFHFKQVPVLELDGKTQICQSKAIERFLARTFDLMGSSDIEAAQIEMLGEEFVDIRSQMNSASGKDAQAKEANFTFPNGEDNSSKYWSTTFPAAMALLEAVANKSGAKECFVGGKISLADIQFFSLCSALSNQEAVQKALAANPTLNNIFVKTSQHPKIVEWVAKRPVTAF